MVEHFYGVNLYDHRGQLLWGSGIPARTRRGAIRATARDYWSAHPDGPAVVTADVWSHFKYKPTTYTFNLANFNNPTRKE